MSVSVDVSANRGVARVEYYLNDRLVGEVTSSPFNLDAYIGDPKIGEGFYELKAVAYDDVQNTNSDSINLNIEFDPLPEIKINWQTPANGQEIETSGFPFVIKASIDNPENIEKIDVYAKDSYGQRNYINTARSFSNNNFTLQWLSPLPPGSYKIFGEIKNNTGASYWSDEITVVIK
jgi:hypothetical protein